MKQDVRWFQRQTNAFWAGLEALINMAMQIISAFVIARIIGPAEVGISAVVIAAYSMVVTFVNTLGQDTLVQPVDLPDETASSYFWLIFYVSLAGAVLFAALGGALTYVVDDPRIPIMCFALAPTVAFMGPAGVIHGMLSRNKCFRSIALRVLIGQSAGTVAGLAAAIFGAGAWSLVLQQAVGAIVGVAALFISSLWRPSFIFSAVRTQSILHYAIPMAFNSLLVVARYRVFTLIAGASLGATALGQMHIAFRLVDAFRDLMSSAFYRLMIPGFAGRRDSKNDVWSYYVRCCSLVAVSSTPVLTVIVVALPSIVSIVMGSAWVPVIPAARALSLLACIHLVLAPSQALQIALGQTRKILWTTSLGFIATALFVMIDAPKNPLEAALVWSAPSLLTYGVLIIQVRKSLDVSLFSIIQPALTPIILCVISGGVIYLATPWLNIDNPILEGESVLLLTAALCGTLFFAFLRQDLRGVLSTLGIKKAPTER